MPTCYGVILACSTESPQRAGSWEVNFTRFDPISLMEVVRL